MRRPRQDAKTETALDRYAAFPYREGTQFVLYLWWKGGWEQVNKAYADPPKTTEQILHPERYLAHDEPLGLKLPDLSDKLGDGWKQVDDSVFGEFDVYNYLRTKTDDDAGPPRKAADGWAGGRMAVYADEPRHGARRPAPGAIVGQRGRGEGVLQEFQLHVKSLEDPQHTAVNWASGDLQTQRILWDGERRADLRLDGWSDLSRDLRGAAVGPGTGDVDTRSRRDARQDVRRIRVAVGLRHLTAAGRFPLVGLAAGVSGRDRPSRAAPAGHSAPPPIAG